MTESICEELKPTVVQHVYECHDGVLYMKKQTLWQCSLLDHQWLEWRDSMDWEPTSESC